MRMLLIVGLAFTLLGEMHAAEPGKQQLVLTSERIGVLGLPLAESTKPVFHLNLSANVDAKGEGTGNLILDLTPLPTYDEFGVPTAVVPSATLKLECQLKFVKKVDKTFVSRRLGAPESEKREYKEEWKLYSLTGPKITTPLFLLVVTAPEYNRADRVLVGDDKGKVKYVIECRLPPQPEPCHPGCFPAGTRIATPSGTKTIEQLGPGDTVSTVALDGKPGQGKITSVFVTHNRLLEVRTETETLVTTETQPLALVDAGLRAAGDLKAGDRIYTWKDGTRQAVTVREVVSTGRSAQVFNLILGEPVLFVANGFLARSKPPAP